MKVVVTGAAGRTGLLVVQKLLEEGSDKGAAAAEPPTVIATVRERNAKSTQKLTAAGLPESAVIEFDLAAAAAAGSAPPALQEALKGADALVVATSGVPQLKVMSLFGVIAGRLTGRKAMPGFTWKKGERPEQIDWLGQKVQIDAAKAAGVRQVVLVSSMGGTQPEHFLNTMGDQGDILQWKRRAEQYLAASGLTYTIIHPGGLIDEAGGAKQLVLGLDDTLLERNPRNIPRADVAALAVGCIGLKEAANRSFDVIAVPPEAGAPVDNAPAKLLAALQGNCDYAINSQA